MRSGNRCAIMLRVSAFTRGAASIASFVRTSRYSSTRYLGTQVPIIGTKFCAFLKNNRYSSAIIVQNCVTTYYYNSMSCGKSEQQHLRAPRRRELSKNSILVTFDHIFSTAMYPIITFSTICYIAQIGRQPASTILISARSTIR